MLNTTQPKNNKCCGCLSVKFGVGLQWFFDLLLCALVLTFIFMVFSPNDIKRELQHGNARVVQLILFSIVSAVSVISGAIGALGGIKLAQKVFNISSIIYSVQLIFCCIWWVILGIVSWKEQKDWAIDVMFAGFCGVMAALHVYGNINTNKFVKSAD
eukprot:472085_1